MPFSKPLPRRASCALALACLGALCAHAFASRAPVAAGSGAAVQRSDVATRDAARSGPSPASHVRTAASPPNPSLGDTVPGAPDVPRPAGTPCVLDLYQNASFDRAGAALIGGTRRFAYAPPAACPGPWAKVVLEASFRNDQPNALDDGIVHAAIELDGVPLYSGGAQDNGWPTNWQIERDVTDYTRVLQAAHQGRATMAGAPLGGAFASAYAGDAKLLFYPATAADPAPRVPDAVHALGDVRAWVALGSPAQPNRAQLARTLTLPPNVERAYLDVMAQGDFGEDLFWFACAPTPLLASYPELASRYALGANRTDPAPPTSQGCGGASFREVEISIDGTPAGVAPVFPRVHPRFNAVWSNPGLFSPAPAPQALNFIPYRVDLSPFAGELSDGSPHTISLRVAGADRRAHFQVSGTLLIYRDPDSAWVTGQVTRNTLVGQAPVATVTSTVHRTASGALEGTIVTTRTRSYAIEGDLTTAHGTARNTVERTVAFANSQDVSGTQGSGSQGTYHQIVDLQSSVTGTSTRSRNGAPVATDLESVAYPLHLEYFGYGMGFSVAMTQDVLRHGEQTRPGQPRYDIDLSDAWSGGNAYDPTIPPLDFSIQHHYAFDDTLGSCFRADIVVLMSGLEGYQLGAGCPNDVNAVDTRARPDGAPNPLGWAEPAVP